MSMSEIFSYMNMVIAISGFLWLLADVIKAIRDSKDHDSAEILEKIGKAIPRVFIVIIIIIVVANTVLGVISHFVS